MEDVNKHGLYLPLRPEKGYLAIGHVTYRHFEKYPGSVNLGAYYESSEFEYRKNPLKKRKGNSGVYLIFDQMLFVKEATEFKGPEHQQIDATHAKRVKQPYRRQTVIPKDRPQGLTLWGAGYYAPDEKINIQKYELAGGLLYQGLFPKRPKDVTAFGVIAGKFIDALAEIVVELNHRLQFGSSMYLTPDLQYIIHPSGKTSIPNALVLGVEASVNF